MQIKRIDGWQIGATKTLIARCHARDGTGANTDQPKEGKYILAADVLTITMKVYNRSGTAPDTSLGSPTITSSAIVTAVTSGYTFRDSDLGPYNFLFDLTTALIATAGLVYRVTVDITLTTGTVLETFGWEGQAFDVSP